MSLPPPSPCVPLQILGCSASRSTSPSGARRRARRQRPTIRAIASSTSASVSVRSAERNVRRSDRLTRRRAPLCRGSDRTRRRARASGSRRADSATNRRRRQGAIDEDRQVAHDRREARQRFGAQIVAGLPRRERVEVELERIQRFVAGKPRASRIAGVELADDDPRPSRRRCTTRRPSVDEVGTAAGANVAVDAERPAQRLDDALDVEEVHRSRTARPMRRCGAAGPHAGNARGPRRSAEARAGLEQPDVALLAPPVVRRRVDQSRQQRRPQDGVLLRQRIATRRPSAASSRTARPPAAR